MNRPPKRVWVAFGERWGGGLECLGVAPSFRALREFLVETEQEEHATIARRYEYILAPKKPAKKGVKR